MNARDAEKAVRRMYCVVPFSEWKIVLWGLLCLCAPSSSSTSARVGMEGCAPWRVTETAAVAAAAKSCSFLLRHAQHQRGGKCSIEGVTRCCGVNCLYRECGNPMRENVRGAIRGRQIHSA